MKDLHFLIGSYAGAGQPSIFSLGVSPDEGSMEIERFLPGTENSSWLLAHSRGNLLYAVEERDPNGGIAVLERRGGGFEVIERLPSEGGAPCHLATDAREEFLFVSNYMSGSLCAYRLGEDGRVAGAPCVLRHRGKGVNPDRQEGPHIHSCYVLGDDVYTADLGLDRVDRYLLNRETGALEETPFFLRFPGGAGPRHMCRHIAHPRLLYVDGEMDGCVYVMSLEDGACLQRARLLPEGFRGGVRASAVKFDGNCLYVGLRDYSALAFLELQEDGLLRLAWAGEFPGRSPRDLWMRDGLMLAANECGSLTLLRRDAEGVPRILSELTVPGAQPIFIMEA